MLFDNLVFFFDKQDSISRDNGSSPTRLKSPIHTTYHGKGTQLP